MKKKYFSTNFWINARIFSKKKRKNRHFFNRKCIIFRTDYKIRITVLPCKQWHVIKRENSGINPKILPISPIVKSSTYRTVELDLNFQVLMPSLQLIFSYKRALKPEFKDENIPFILRFIRNTVMSCKQCHDTNTEISLFNPQFSPIPPMLKRNENRTMGLKAKFRS